MVLSVVERCVQASTLAAPVQEENGNKHSKWYTFRGVP